MHRLMAPLMSQTTGDKISKGKLIILTASISFLLPSWPSPLYLIFSLSLSSISFFFSPDTGSNAVLLSHILDLLTVCVEKHSHYIRKYVIDKNLLGRVLVLMTSAHRHLTLGWSFFLSLSLLLHYFISFLSFLEVLSQDHWSKGWILLPVPDQTWSLWPHHKDSRVQWRQVQHGQFGDFGNVWIYKKCKWIISLCYY